MKKHITLPVLALAGGIAGCALRRWQLVSAFQPETGLFTHGAPATFALLGLTALLGLLFLFLVQGQTGDRPADFLPAFGCPQPGQMAALTAAAMLFFVSFALMGREGLAQLRLWRMDPDGHMLTYPAALLVTALLSLPAGAAVLLMGRAAYRGEMTSAVSCLAPFPAFTGLVWLFATHLEHGTEPVLMRYGFSLAAAALLMLAHYYVAGYLFGRPHVRRALFCSLAGAALGLISLADRPGLAVGCLTLAFVLSALTFSYALLHNAFGPPWPGRMPSGAQDEDDEDPDNDQHFTEEF